ncbi:unnamed protein product [Kuraishia capsulata CBS 1993]|uniref:Uncharacterized protein n=1 Tax=Kuraishia capsulata CBS 1993 TaxID=1382522 RepID=W6MQB9_9ASCO|nr:uncharacterized protein KUCA_T00004481001 [Kuraishia capsulata CBS 1993]CDK28498.1 unnamed protein product [Kuraishia capsulata CBS 1993]
MICDLNVPWPRTDYSSPTGSEILSLKKQLAILEELGYTHIALNFTLDQGVKLPSGNVNPIDLKLVQEFQSRLKIFTRVTLIIDDVSSHQGLSKLNTSFDLISVIPRSEKALQLAASNLEIDLISLPFHQRLPFYLKHKTVCSATDRGVLFEINYGDMISDDLKRRNFFGNVKGLIRASRKRGMVLSSGTSDPLSLRGSFDAVNLLVVLGLDYSRAQATVTEQPTKALLNGRLRLKSHKQAVVMGTDILNDSENIGHKRRKVETIVDRI